MRRLLASLAAAALASAVPRPACAAGHFGLVDTGELFVSADGGTSWSVRAALPVRDAAALIAGATSSDLLLVSRTGSFYRSGDAGLTWTAIGSVPAPDIAALVPYPGRLLVFTRTGSVYASLDGGSSFDAAGALTVPDLAGAAIVGASVFAVTRTGSVYRSTDAGVTWGPVGTLPASDVVAMAALLDRLYVLTSTGDLACSSDLGASWDFTSTLSQSGMTSLLASAGELLASTAAGEVAASGDGATWTWRGSIDQLTVMALASDQPNPLAVGAPERTPPSFALGGNPARGVATLLFDLEREAEVTVTAFDVAGREVGRPIAGERLPSGRFIRAWHPEGLASGFYWLRARIGAQSETRGMVWVR